MKKSNTKLQLKTSTIRFLQNDELAGVNGGGAGDRPRTPTNTPTQCSGSYDCHHHHDC